jgi:hypothetical protein
MRKVSFVLVALMLGGCQSLGMGGADDVPAPQPTVTAPPPAMTAPAVAPAPSANTGLIGMTADALKSFWGEPPLRRKEAGAEMWQYGGGGTCTLLVYLYANSASNVMTVTHAEAMPGGSDDASIAACEKSARMPPLKPIS